MQSLRQHRPFEVRAAEVLVVGSGVAGLSVALACAPRSVILLTKGRLGEGGSSAWAQGGVAAALGADDSPRLHAEDTLSVGGGLNDLAAVELLTREGPGRVLELVRLGARFDRRGDALALGREAGHRRRRIAHARGDATGAEIVRTLVATVRRAPGLRVAEDTLAVDLVTDASAGGRVVGLLAVGADGRRVLFLAGAVVFASGGIGRLYRATTNPPEVTGDGLAMAARAGAVLADVEMMQFHPTALAAGGDPLPLLTEALRGEGATVVDQDGRRFLPAVHPDAELAPRDIVARAIWRRTAAGGRVFLDARSAVGERFPRRFPTVFAACREHGLDPRTELIPVSPAAHYHMGGIETDLDGRTSLAGLWACGEAACTGVHGANRLASNSLLEGLVFGARVATDLTARPPALPALPGGAGGLERLRTAAPVDPAWPDPAGSSPPEAALRELAWRDLGLVRSARSLGAADAELARLGRRAGADLRVRNLVLVARLLSAAASARRESRGGHYREDFPAPDAGLARRATTTLTAAGEVLVEAAPAPPMAAARGAR